MAIEPSDEIGQGKYYEEASGGHGRHEISRCWVMDDLPSWLEGEEKWKGLRRVAAMESKRTVHGVSHMERRYFITSLDPSCLSGLLGIMLDA